jgi:hypothetical protein
MELVQTRRFDGQKQYRCPIDGWVVGTLWHGTGYAKRICEHCGTELDSDPLGELAYEQEKEGQE